MSRTAHADDRALAARLLETLAKRGQWLATAESLTGGLVCAALTAVPGSSRALRGGVVAYAIEVKQELLGVDPRLLERHGVVSSQCAVAMANGVRVALSADWAIATTGEAGPESASGEPVGTVWIGVAGPGGSRAVQAQIDRRDGSDRAASHAQSRAEIRSGSVTAALEAALAAVGAAR